MSHLLRASAVLLLIWAALLLCFRGAILAPEAITPVVHTLANGWAFADVALAVVFLRAAADPPRHVSAIVVAMLLMTLKTGNDLYGLLWLPPMHALAILVDLVLSVGLLVGMLRELPRTMDAAPGADR